MTGMTISTKDISELRARTGAGIGDCKKALEEAGGDMAKAGELLRAKGIAKAEKRAGRSASQGLIGIEILGGGASGGMIELDCETDFVARTEEYHTVLNAMTSFVARSAPVGVTEVGADGAFLTTAYAGSTVDEVVKATSAKTGEAVQLRRIARFAPANGVVGHYLHHNEQVGTLVEIEGATGEAALALAKDLALHVASADPLAVAAVGHRQGAPRARAPHRRGAGGGRGQAGEHPGQDRRGQAQEVRERACPAGTDLHQG